MEISNYKTVLAAVCGNKLPSVAEGSSGNTHEIIAGDYSINTIVRGDQINHIQNINVFVAGQENVDHIKSLSLEELGSKIGFNPAPETIMNFFQLRRLDENPSNHSLLLPGINSNTLHFKGVDGWQTTEYNEKIRSLLHEDNLLLQSRFKESELGKYYDFYWGYLVHDLMTKCTRMDWEGLKPIIDGLRKPIHELTQRLAESQSGDLPGVDISERDLLNQEAIALEKQLIIIKQKEVQAKLNSLSARK